MPASASPFGASAQAGNLAAVEARQPLSAPALRHGRPRDGPAGPPPGSPGSRAALHPPIWKGFEYFFEPFFTITGWQHKVTAWCHYQCTTQAGCCRVSQEGSSSSLRKRQYYYISVVFSCQYEG